MRKWQAPRSRGGVTGGARAPASTTRLTRGLLLSSPRPLAWRCQPQVGGVPRPPRETLLLPRSVLPGAPAVAGWPCARGCPASCQRVAAGGEPTVAPDRSCVLDRLAQQIYPSRELLQFGLECQMRDVLPGHGSRFAQQRARFIRASTDLAV